MRAELGLVGIFPGVSWGNGHFGGDSNQSEVSKEFSHFEGPAGGMLWACASEVPHTCHTYWHVLEWNAMSSRGLSIIQHHPAPPPGQARAATACGCHRPSRCLISRDHLRGSSLTLAFPLKASPTDKTRTAAAFCYGILLDKSKHREQGDKLGPGTRQKSVVICILHQVFLL